MPGSDGFSRGDAHESAPALFAVPPKAAMPLRSRRCTRHRRFRALVFAIKIRKVGGLFRPTDGDGSEDGIRFFRRPETVERSGAPFS